MIKKLVKHGNSYAIIIDKPILDLLKITPDTELEVETNGSTLTFSPRRDPIQDREFDEALNWMNRSYGTALRNLGKGA